MCGRYVAPDAAAVERFWHLHHQNWHETDTPLFNVAPTACVPILRRSADGSLTLDGARWGLVPAWWKKDAAPSHTFNARSEEAAQKPMWRHALQGARCLLPARGWYEWDAEEKVRVESGRLLKQPWFITSDDSEILAFAGLWSVLEREGRDPLLSCAILTRAAEGDIARIHNRMPVVLAPEQHADWLHPRAGPDRIDTLMHQSHTHFRARRVSPRVNNVRNNDPGLLADIAASS